MNEKRNDDRILSGLNASIPNCEWAHFQREPRLDFPAVKKLHSSFSPHHQYSVQKAELGFV